MRRSHTARPSAEYRQHHDVAEPQVDAGAFRQGWRVSTRLDGLLAAGLIGRAAWQAGSDFRSTWERAFGVGLTPSGMPVTGRAVHSDRTMASRIDAQSRLRAIVATIGSQQAWLIEQCAVHDKPWRITARSLGMSDKTARTWTAEALWALAGARHDPEKRRPGALPGPRRPTS